MKIVLPICKSDFALALCHAQWIASLNVKYPNTAVVCWERSFESRAIEQFIALLKTIFASVEQFRYAPPPIIAWPIAPNWAFQHVATHMSNQSEPWLWLEADAVLLRADSIPRIEHEYKVRDKAWMGPVVKGMSHPNGVSVYPADAAHRMPKAMECRELAWDYVMREEVSHSLHDCSDLFCHVWTVENDQAKQHGTGEAPKDFTVGRAKRWITPGSLLFHRAKDFSLLGLLQRGELKP